MCGIRKRPKRFLWSKLLQNNTHNKTHTLDSRIVLSFMDLAHVTKYPFFPFGKSLFVPILTVVTDGKCHFFSHTRISYSKCTACSCVCIVDDTEWIGKKKMFLFICQPLKVSSTQSKISEFIHLTKETTVLPDAWSKSISIHPSMSTDDTLIQINLYFVSSRLNSFNLYSLKNWKKRPNRLPNWTKPNQTIPNTHN